MNTDRALMRALEIAALSWQSSAGEVTDRPVTVAEVHKLIAIAFDEFRDILANELDPDKVAGR